ncbi:hypothetical protein CM1200mP19_1930 [bacterium]|nr:MAG: hypothetical protein CM1200mP19_1930 [bacterium]
MVQGGEERKALNVVPVKVADQRGTPGRGLMDTVRDSVEAETGPQVEDDRIAPGAPEAQRRRYCLRIAGCRHMDTE